VPVAIGAGGVERVIELELSDKEKKELQVSVSHVQELVAAMDKVLAGTKT
jgi:malate dehydrogenase